MRTLTTLLVMTLIIFAEIVSAERVFADPLLQFNRSLNNTAPNAQFCYLPSQSNVNVENVINLPTEQPDQIISYGDNALQYGELWLPTKGFSDSTPPLVILIHGGCWLNSYDINHTHALSTGLRHSGYAVWSIEYRRIGDQGGGWPGTFSDVKKSIDRVLKLNNAAFDKSNIAIVGHSSGGHLALLAGSKLKHHTQIKTVIGLAAVVDIVKYAKGQSSCAMATEKLMGGTAKQLPEKYRNANPSQVLLHPNTVLIQGTLDGIVPPEQATYADNTHRIMVEGAGHFDAIHPGTESFQRLLEQLGTHL